MCYAPEVQKKAQEEIDLFTIKKDRWPSIEERNSFPYVQALVTEVYRWGLVAPLGVPHRLVEDLDYQTFTIPKDTTLVTNAWFAHSSEFLPLHLHGNTFQGQFVKTKIFILIHLLLIRNDSLEKIHRLIHVKLFLGVVAGMPTIVLSLQLISSRICPGVDMADAIMFMAVAAILSVFDIKSNPEVPLSYTYVDRMIR